MADKIPEFEKEILTIIKNKFDPAHSFAYCSNDPNNKFSYYLKEMDKHLYEPMDDISKKAYDDGKGSELKGKNPKICALRSSSALTYNIFGNYNSFEFENNKYYEKLFEFKDLPTLINSNAPANMDVFLKGDNKLIFFEMKMCEWLLNTSSREISISYLKPENYSDSKLADCAINCIKNMANTELYNYDALQMFKHTLGIYNYLQNKKNSTPKEVELINCIWSFKNDSGLSPKSKKRYEDAVEDEKKGFEKFLSCMKQFIDLFTDTLHINLKIRMIFFEDLYKKLKIENETSEHKDFLSRYYF